MPKTTKRGRETSVQEPEEPEKVTPKRAKTQVRCFQSESIAKYGSEIAKSPNLAIFIIFIIVNASYVAC